jgi:hypothetical protein
MSKTRLVAAVAVGSVLLACSSAQPTPGGDVSSASDRPGATPAANPCARLPVSSGPLSKLARVVVNAPRSGPAGQVVSVSSVIKISADGARVITSSASSDLLIVRDDRVVGRSGPLPERTDIPLPLKAGAARPGQAVPTSVRLSGCPTVAGGAAAPLPAGEYGLVAVLGYRLDPLNAAADGARAGGSTFVLVSEPVTITVT